MDFEQNQNKLIDKIIEKLRDPILLTSIAFALLLLSTGVFNEKRFQPLVIALIVIYAISIVAFTILKFQSQKSNIEINHLPEQPSNQTDTNTETAVSENLFWKDISNEFLVIFGVEAPDAQHPQISFRDLRAAHKLSLYLARTYKDKTPLPLPLNADGWNELVGKDTSIILVGGFVKNKEYTRAIDKANRQQHCYWRLKMGRICALSTRQCHHVEFSSLPPGMDTVPRDDPNKLDSIPSKYVSTDYVLITSEMVPYYNHSRRIITVAGIKGHGTAGGAEFLTHIESLDHLHKHLGNRVKTEDTIEILVRIDVANQRIDEMKLLGIAVNGSLLFSDTDANNAKPCELEAERKCKGCTFGEGEQTNLDTINKNKLKRSALILDLDDTLANTSETLKACLEADVVNHVCNTVEHAPSAGTLSTFLSQLHRKYPNNIFEMLSNQFSMEVAKQVEDVQREMVKKLDVRILDLKPGASEFLKEATEKHDMYLLTEGDDDFQKSKIEHLSIAHYFNDIVIVNQKNKDTKEKAIGRIINTGKYSPTDVTVIGNRLDKEIADGKTLGCKTIWVKSGEGCEMQPEDGKEPDYTICHLDDLNKMLNDIN